MNRRHKEQQNYALCGLTAIIVLLVLSKGDGLCYAFALITSIFTLAAVLGTSEGAPPH